VIGLAVRRPTIYITAMESAQSNYPRDVVPDHDLLPSVKRCANRIYPLVVHDASDCLLDQAMRQVAPQLPIRIRDICVLVTKNTAFRVRSQLRNCTDLEAGCPIMKGSGEPVQTGSAHSSPLRLSGIVTRQSSDERQVPNPSAMRCMAELFDEPNVHEASAETNPTVGHQSGVASPTCGSERQTGVRLPLKRRLEQYSKLGKIKKRCSASVTNMSTVKSPTFEAGPGAHHHNPVSTGMWNNPENQVDKDCSFSPSTEGEMGKLKRSSALSGWGDPERRRVDQSTVPEKPAASTGSGGSGKKRPTKSTVPDEPVVPIGSHDHRQNQCQAATRAQKDVSGPQPESRYSDNDDETDSWRTALEQYQAETTRALSTLFMNMKRNR